MKIRHVVISLLANFVFGSMLVASPEPAKPPVHLVLAISIDQMRYDYLVRFAPLFKHGIAKLLSNGAVFSEARYRHAATETGPGHAVIMSGKHGSHSGIVANAWYDSYLKKVVNVVDDPLHRSVGGKGRSASPANFDGFTLGDALKLKHAQAKVVGVSSKDRAAILMAGKLADGAFWFEKAEGKYVTSSYYMKQAPAWLTNLNNKHIADQFFKKSWNRLQEDVKLYEKFAGPDAVLGERDSKDNTFPHLIRGTQLDATFYADLLVTPFADEVVLDYALEAQKAYRLGEDTIPDLLAIGFSATDVIGHTYGPDSQEIMDQLLRLDVLLERLFNEIDTRIGLQKTIVMLTADHGVMPLVETLKSKGLPAERVKPEEIQKRVEAALQKRFGGKTGLISFSDSPDFWLDKEKIQSYGLPLEDVENEIIEALKATGWVQKVYRKSDFFKSLPKNDPDFAFYQNSFSATRSADIIGNLKPYIFMDTYGGGTGHGSPHEYDRHVPIIFMGASIQQGSYPKPCGPEDIAPTLASMLGLELPKENDSRLLSEMLK